MGISPGLLGNYPNPDDHFRYHDYRVSLAGDGVALEPASQQSVWSRLADIRASERNTSF